MSGFSDFLSDILSVWPVLLIFGLSLGLIFAILLAMEQDIDEARKHESLCRETCRPYMVDSCRDDRVLCYTATATVFVARPLPVEEVQ